MNEIRRKYLRNVVKCLRDMENEALSTAHEMLEDAANEEEEMRDAMPENLQGSDRYCDSEEASDYMEQALSAMDDITSSIADAIEALESIPKVAEQ